jgi:hypothetical protein
MSETSGFGWVRWLLIFSGVALLLLIGINNRKITKFTTPAGGFETAANDAGEKAKEKAVMTADARGLTAEQRAAAAQIAASEARARAYALQHAVGRSLTAVEIEKVAADGALIGVDFATPNPSSE